MKLWVGRAVIVSLGVLGTGAVGGGIVSPYGICAHLTGEEFDELDRSLDRISDLGVKWLRMDFRWWMCNDGSDVWKFDRFDAVVDAAERRGITVLPVLAGEPAGFRPLDEHLDAWTNFVRRIVSRYAKRIPVWEIMNEVNHPGNFRSVTNAVAYVKVLRAAYRTIKSIDANLKVSMAGMAGVALEYLDEMHALGAKDCCDIINVHPYSYPKTPEGKSLGNMLQLKREIARWQWDAPLWLSEFGFATQLPKDPSGSREADEDQQANYIARFLGFSFALGFDTAFCYELRAPEANPRDRESHFGLLHADFSEKPAFAAYRMFIKARPEGSVQCADAPWNDGKGFFFPQWTWPNGMKVGMLWKTGSPVTNELVFSTDAVRFADRSGRTIEFPRNGRRIKVEISESPVYFLQARLEHEMGLKGRPVEIWTRITSVNARGEEDARAARCKVWRGERVHAQFALWCGKPAGDVRLSVSDVIGPDGVKLPASSVALRVVREVEGIPDLLEPCHRFSMGKDGHRAFWLTVEVPRDAVPGRYVGRVTADSASGGLVELPVELEVLRAALPERNPFFLDVWQNATAVARYHKVKPYSAAHYEVLKPLFRELAAAGQKAITLPITLHPWGKGSEIHEFVPLIRDVRFPDGRCDPDFTAFDEYVDFARDCGIGPQLHCYGIAKIADMEDTWYVDGVTGEERRIALKPASDAYKDFWKPFLERLEGHVREKSWAKDTYIAIDEASPDVQCEVARFVREVAPSLKLAGASNKDPRLFRGVKFDAFSQLLYRDYMSDEFLSSLKDRAADGCVTTFYVCTQPFMPNTWMTSPLEETEWIGLYCAAKGFDGFLRWAAFHWTKDPLVRTTNGRFGFRPGELHLLYPGARASVRWEVLRDSIEDFRKISALRDRGLLSRELTAALSEIDFETARRQWDWIYRSKNRAVLSAIDSAAEGW